MRVKQDNKRGDYYIDVLLGTKGNSKPHAHIGINPDQSLRFADPRGVLQGIRRKIESKMFEQLEDKSVMLQDRPEKGRLTFSVIIDEPTRTIKVQVYEAKITENR